MDYRLTIGACEAPFRRQRTAQAGQTSDWKKAIVTLTPDSKRIELFEGA